MRATDKVAMKLKNGKEVQRMVLMNDISEIEKAQVILNNEMRLYKRDYFKMWILVILGILLGLVISPLTF